MKEGDELVAKSVFACADEYKNVVSDVVFSVLKGAERILPAFDEKSNSAETVDDFSNRPELLSLTQKYLEDIQTLWGKLYPNSPALALNNKKIEAKNVRLLQFQNFDLLTAPSVGPRVESVRNVPSPTSAPIKSQQPTPLPPQLPAKVDAGKPEQSLASHSANSSYSAPVPNKRPPDASAGKDETARRPFVPTNSGKVEPPKMPIFKIPNCKVGEKYSGKIEASHSSGRSIRVMDVKVPVELNLAFDPDSETLSGIPSKDGEFSLALSWGFTDHPGEGKQSGTVRLIANPDPKSLWKVIEPESTLPYHKEHTDRRLVCTPTGKIIAASRRGRSHEHGGSFRDDDFYIAFDEISSWGALIVADGAGSAKFSREGSRIVVTTVGDQLMSALTSTLGAKTSSLCLNWDTNPEVRNIIKDDFYSLFHRAALSAVEAVEEESKKFNATFKDYSTTLLLTVFKRLDSTMFVSTFWIGDGVIAAYDGASEVKILGAPDSGEFAGQTRFLDRNILADKDLMQRLKIGIIPANRKIILFTDGVSDPYFETDNGLLSSERWAVLWKEIQPLLVTEQPDLALLDWLHFFKAGHHDDRTAIIAF